MAGNRGADKQAFMQIFSYALSHVSFEKLLEDDLLDTYMVGMGYYEKVFGNREINQLTEADIEFLLCLESKPLTGEEIAERLSLSGKTVANRINKALEKGLCGTFYEKFKKNRYYELTVYGKQRLREEIMKMED